MEVGGTRPTAAVADPEDSVGDLRGELGPLSTLTDEYKSAGLVDMKTELRVTSSGSIRSLDPESLPSS